MAVKSMILKVKYWLLVNEREIVLVSAFLLISAISFGLGILWQREGGVKAPIVINKSKLAFNEQNQGIENQEAEGKNQEIKIGMVANILYVASKNGTSYHLPDCPGAKQIKPENKVEFKTKEEAEKAGYKPAGNCPGILQ